MSVELCMKLLEEADEAILAAKQQKASWLDKQHSVNKAERESTGWFIGQALCILTAPTIGPFAACEAAATAGAVFAEESLEEAEEAMELADDLFEGAVAKAQEAQDKLCECIRETAQSTPE
jgi:hypothetical protein